MVNTRRTEFDGNGQERSNGPLQNLTEAEMLRHVYGATLNMEERLRRLEDGRANKGSNQQNENNTQDINAESEEGNSGHYEKSVPHLSASKSNESAKHGSTSDMFKVWKHINCFHPKTFSGGLPSEAESWIDRLEMLLDSVECDEFQRVLVAKTLLAGSALDWWNTVKPIDGHQLEWDEFKKMFMDYYFPVEARHQKEAEFFILRQGEMDENGFIARFMELAKYVSQLNRTEEDHNNWLARQMLEKCNDEVKIWMGTYEVTTLEKLIAKIREVCRRHKDAERSTRRDSYGRFSNHVGVSGGISKKSY